ncbi:PR domain zinc finger protein 14-like isoform X1 [Montipora foliosa]|uniref:PR domain zinc finger protein 14-like isoform X1 n=2 Tax=Montipora foliosa TaxID=591990 RepID=UPI0035F1BD22
MRKITFDSSKMHKIDQKNAKYADDSSVLPLPTWKFTFEDLNFSLYGYFTSNDEDLAVNQRFQEKSSNSPAVRFVCSSAVVYKLKLPSSVPDNLQLIGATLDSGTHFAVLCSQSRITKGTRYGPYTGRRVESSDVTNATDTALMWEVYGDEGLSHYIDGQTEPENWMKFVNCARHSEEQNVALIQEGDQLFYECCKDIHPGEELLIWYGNCYTLSMGVPVELNVGTFKEGLSALSAELEFNDSPGDYKCNRCGKVFAYKYYRDRHRQYTRCIDTGDRKFPCTICDRSFDKRDRLRIHVLHVHEKHRPHECAVCGKRFSQSSSLNKHMRVHSGERPYKCPHCVKAFSASSILRTHLRQHSGEKPFKCQHCDRAFASHAAHDSHVRRTHTKEKPCVCEFCGKAFAQSYELKFHLNMHTGAKPYTCEKCGRAFSSPSSRDRHRANFDCVTKKNRAPKVMRKNQANTQHDLK